jgi:hypothetical protein
MSESATVSINDLMACLGSLLFLCSDIERVLREQVARQQGTDPSQFHGITACLRCWRSGIRDTENSGDFRAELADALVEQLQHAITMRNGLCHGLTGFSSGCEQSAQLRWRLNDCEGRVSYKELQDLFKWMSRLPRAFLVLSSPSVDGKFSRCVDTAENRQWWQTEFSLHLFSVTDAAAQPLQPSKTR